MEAQALELKKFEERKCVIIVSVKEKEAALDEKIKALKKTSHISNKLLVAADFTI